MMIRKKLFGSLLVIVLLIAASCSESGDRSVKVRSIGNTSEILVVVENEQQWDGIIGQAIRNYFGREQYGLPQPEPVYNLAHISKSGLSDLLRKHRNILIVDIDKNAETTKMESSTDLWAKPQEVIKITAPSAGDFVKVFDANAKVFEEKYNETERKRILSVFNTSVDVKVLKKLKSGFGLKMIVPTGFYTAKSEPDFMWIRKEVAKYGQGILVLSEQYKDTAQFSNPSIVSRINRFMKVYVPGPSDRSFMTIDNEHVLPRSELVNDFPLGYAIKTTGLWKVEHDFMGGPFVAYTFHDEKNNTIVTILGYVYQPNKKKRDLLRQLEAIIYSVRFI